MHGIEIKYTNWKYGRLFMFAMDVHPFVGCNNLSAEMSTGFSRIPLHAKRETIERERATTTDDVVFPPSRSFMSVLKELFVRKGKIANNKTSKKKLYPQIGCVHS